MLFFHLCSLAEFLGLDWAPGYYFSGMNLAISNVWRSYSLVIENVTLRANNCPVQYFLFCVKMFASNKWLSFIQHGDTRSFILSLNDFRVSSNNLFDPLHCSVFKVIWLDQLSMIRCVNLWILFCCAFLKHFGADLLTAQWGHQ